MGEKSYYEQLRDDAEKLKQKKSKITSLVEKIDDNLSQRRIAGSPIGPNPLNQRALD